MKPWLAAPLLLVGRLVGQETGAVYGSVTDTSGHGLPHAFVRATRTDVGKAIAVVYSDGNGSYRFDSLPAGRLEIDAGLIGYRPVKDSVMLQAGDSIRVDFRLPPNPVLLSPTIVTAGKRSQLLDQAITSVVLVEQEQVARRAVNRIDEALDRAPGVQLISGQVNIRGSSGFVQGLGSRVLLLVDGVPMNQGDRGGINWDIIPVDRVERVEVVKGAGSALYGSSAFGGVVNLITRELPVRWHGRLRASVGAFADPPSEIWGFRTSTGIQDGLDVAGSYGQDNARGEVSLGARHSDGYRQQDEADHWQVTGKGEWQPEPAAHVSLSGAWASDQYGVPEPWCGLNECDDRGEAIQPFKIDLANLGNRTRSDKGYLTAIVTRVPSQRLTWLARASWLRTHFTDAYPNRPTAQGGPTDYSIANRYGFEGRIVSQPDPSRVVTVGVEGTIANVWSNIFSGDTASGAGRHTQGEYAAYAEAEQTLGPTRVTIGARSDLLVVDGGGLTAFVSPRIGAVWPTSTGTWRGSMGRAFRAASLSERFVTTYALSFRVIPNPALTSEEGWSVELGRSWTAVSWLRGDGALFWTEARRLIEPVFTPAAQIQFQNLQRARLLGLDLSLNATPVPRLTTALAYQYLYAQELETDTSPQRPLLFRPRHLLTLSGDYAIGSVSLGADFRFSSRFERADPLYPQDPRLNARVLDLRASWTAGPVEVRVKAANVLNYIYNLAPRTLEPVRTLTLVVTYTR